MLQCHIMLHPLVAFSFFEIHCSLLNSFTSPSSMRIYVFPLKVQQSIIKCYVMLQCHIMLHPLVAFSFFEIHCSLLNSFTSPSSMRIYVFPLEVQQSIIKCLSLKHTAS